MYSLTLMLLHSPSQLLQCYFVKMFEATSLVSTTVWSWQSDTSTNETIRSQHQTKANTVTGAKLNVHTRNSDTSKEQRHLRRFCHLFTILHYLLQNVWESPVSGQYTFRDCTVLFWCIENQEILGRAYHLRFDTVLHRWYKLRNCFWSCHKDNRKIRLKK